MSASLIIPTSFLSATTGSRRIWCFFIAASASAMSASAAIHRGVPSARSPAVTLDGSWPRAMHFTTMSRSVIMPVMRSLMSQTGRAPTFSDRISWAARSSVSVAGMQRTPLCMMSLAVVMLTVPP